MEGSPRPEPCGATCAPHHPGGCRPVPSPTLAGASFHVRPAVVGRAPGGDPACALVFFCDLILPVSGAWESAPVCWLDGGTERQGHLYVSWLGEGRVSAKDCVASGQPDRCMEISWRSVLFFTARITIVMKCRICECQSPWLECKRHKGGCCACLVHGA